MILDKAYLPTSILPLQSFYRKILSTFYLCQDQNENLKQIQKGLEITKTPSLGVFVMKSILCGLNQKMIE